MFNYNSTIMTPKQKLQKILNGEMDFYFRFKRIGVYKDGRLLANLTDENSPGGGSVFKRGGMLGGIVAKIDIDEDRTWNMVQNLGVFRNTYSGFDLWLDVNGWHLNTDEINQYSIVYPVNASGIDFLVLVAEGENIRLQIVSGDYIILLTDVLNFH